MENKYKVVILERRYIVIGTEEVKKILKKFQTNGVSVELINEDKKKILAEIPKSKTGMATQRV